MPLFIRVRQQNKFFPVPKLSPAVEELETAVVAKDRSSIRKAVEKYAAAFSSAAFANLASAGIWELIKLVTH